MKASFLRKLELKFGPDDTLKSAEIFNVRRFTKLITIKIPQFATTVQATFTIKDMDGVEIYKVDNLAMGKTHVLQVEVPCDGTYTVQLSEKPNSEGIVEIRIYIVE